MTALRVPVAVGSGGLFSIALFWVLRTFVNAPPDLGAITPIRMLGFTRPIQTKRSEPVKRAPPRSIVDAAALQALAR